MKKKEMGLLAYFARHNRAFANKVGYSRAISTYRRYLVVYKHLEMFVQETYHRDDLPVSAVGISFVDGLDTWLRVHCSLSPNSVWVYMTVFKHIIMMAHNEGLIRVNPFASYTNSYTGVDRGYLSEGDLLRLMEVPTCSAVEVQVRDIFLFSAFTGLSYVDVKNLRSNHLQKHFDGHYWVITGRQKTGVLSSIRLLDVPLRLTDKYRDTLPDGRLFPVPSNNCCNENLKKMARRAGIGVHLTFHVARHTFAMLALNRGMPIETLSQILGHKNIRTTQIYAKISNRKISEEIALLEDNLSDFETHISLKI